MKYSRLGGAVLSGLVMVTSVVTVTAAPAHAVTAIPPWEDSVANGGDPNHNGSLTLFDASGNQITSGNLADLPFLGNATTGYVEASTTLRAGDTKATLYGATPANGSTPDKWCTRGMSASTFYPAAAGPASITSATTPVVTIAGTDGNLSGFVQSCPSSTPFTNFANVYQLRVRTTAPGISPTTTYATADVQVDPGAGTWTQIYPAPPPPTAPAAPTGVGATPGPGTLDLAWTAPSNHGAAITKYTVTATPNPPVTGFGAVTMDVTTSSAHLTHLAGNAPYDIQVTATNSAGTGPASTTVQGTPQAPIVPGSPLNLSALAGTGSISLSWVTPDDGGAPLSNYSLTYNVHGSAAVATVTPAPGPADTSAVIGGLTSGTHYDVQLVAHNSVGASTPATASATLAVHAPGAPTGVSAAAGNGTAVVSFAGPADNGGAAVTSYTVHASTGETVSGAGSPLTLAVPNGTSRTFTVTAANSAGTSPESAASNAVVFYSSAISIRTTVATAVAGTTLRVYGTVTSGPASAQPIRLYVYPSGHAAQVVAGTTTSTGAYSFAVRPWYTTSYKVVYDGDGTHGAASSALVRVGVRTRVTVTSPRNLTRTATRTLAVTGATGPNRAGAYIYLYELRPSGAVRIGVARVTRYGTYRIAHTFTKGTHVLQVRIGASAWNLAGNSARVTLYEV